MKRLIGCSFLTLTLVGAIVALGAWSLLSYHLLVREKIEVEGVVRWNTSGLPTEEGGDGFGVYLPKPSKDYLNFFAQMAGSKKRRR